MIFSLEKWDNANEMKRYISVSSALDFKTVEAPLRNSFETYIRPLLGEDLTQKLIEIYNSENQTPKETKFLELAQSANSRLALWDNYEEMQILISSAGFKRQESEQSTTPYKYQEQALKRSWKEKGFNALDTMLRYLEENKELFPQFLKSDHYTESIKSIVRNASEVNKYYFINNSRLIYLRLKQHLFNVSIGVIKSRIGADLYDDLIQGLQADQVEEKYSKLREVLVPVVVFYALSRLVKETGSITERGLFFSSLSGSAQGNEFAHQPVSDERLTMQANILEADAITYWKIAEQHLNANFDFAGSGGTKIHRRNNNNKKSFWA